MRLTLQEQWDGLIAALEGKKRDCLAAILAERPKPGVIYSLESYKSIRALFIDDVVVFVNLPSFGKKPTRRAIAELRSIVDAFKPTEENTFYSWHCDNDYGRTSGWLKFSEFVSSGRHALTREALMPKQRELAAKYAPRDGYKPCDYCGTQRRVEELKPHTIISRQYPNFKKVGMYCPDTGCGGYDQMAHEG